VSAPRSDAFRDPLGDIVVVLPAIDRDRRRAVSPFESLDRFLHGDGP
jgi:hypothetical protein